MCPSRAFGLLELCRVRVHLVILTGVVRPCPLILDTCNADIETKRLPSIGCWRHMETYHFVQRVEQMSCANNSLNRPICDCL